jgi:hypothetical protein
MRIPLTSVYTPPKDDRKVIMFIDDIFHSKWHPALKPVKELLDTEYRCITILNHRDPERMVKTIRRLSLVSSKPDIIVAYGTGATIAAQIKVVEKVLIKPYYNTSNVLKNMLGEKMKERIELPTLGKPEYLTITRQMLTEYRQIEEKIYRQGIQNAQTLFFGSDTETPAYNDYVEHFGPAHILPAKNSFSLEAQDCVVKFIRETLENCKG